MTEEDYIFKVASIGFSLAMLLSAYILKTKCRSWVAPPVVFSLFWFFFTFFPLVVMTNVPSNPMATLYIFACTLAFSIPAFLTNWNSAREANHCKQTTSPNLYNNQILTLGFFSMQGIVILCMLANLAIQGYSPYEFVTDLIGTANRYLSDRYNGHIEPNIFAQIGVILNYTANCIGGLIIANKSNIKRALIFLCSFIPAGLHMVIYADKGTLFLCAAFFYSGVLVARMHAGSYSLTNKVTNKVIFLSVILLFPILIASFLARGIGEGTIEETIKKLEFYLSSYAFGSFYAFSDWFSSVYLGYSNMEYALLKQNTYGLYTFMAIFKAMGNTTYIPEGYYDEYYNYHNIIQSNIYTMFRGLITDFSIIGSLVYFTLTGFLFNLAYFTMLKARKPVISVALYMCFIAYTYSSFLISIMTWNSIFAVFIAVCAILGVNSYLSNKRFYFIKS
ncbi:hypothetical protein C4K38_0874 [Pseudomonas chlororaphis subsp. piscium]|uniref:O-antigen polymerase n=4 Tax=Pseudomonas chlororaphis TaxID=587753 RepID=UPI00087B2CAD|nr:O-antigen polymerase [Pseudomonas chlororaphis]AZC28853.1 hypothetical protein C4K38_0874 [Pseudomonas chlororaphis subsp. piscium]WDG92856.1 O-antigen ligase [Pseudomonas chlororaphis]SDT46827.1 oligosaccharide repeat unit polymerase [Pseudomonas chlororaphis]